MNIRKGDPPKAVERQVTIELTRDEVLSILVSHLKLKLQGYPIRFEEIQVAGDDNGALTLFELSGVEVIPLNWDKQDKPEKPAEPAK
jgi:hypothetical protein